MNSEGGENPLAGRVRCSAAELTDLLTAVRRLDQLWWEYHSKETTMPDTPFVRQLAHHVSAVCNEWRRMTGQLPPGQRGYHPADGGSVHG